MFDIGASELLMIVIVAVVVIGPKDMPLAMRTAGRWIGKMRKVSGHFRSGIDAMVREAELEDMERKWREQNEAIMKSAPQLPTAEEMQAPSGRIAQEEMTPLPDAAPEPDPQGSTDKRQAELHLPPPPP
jgi:twin arginine-targeting protein translocase TatB